MYVRMYICAYIPAQNRGGGGDGTGEEKRPWEGQQGQQGAVDHIQKNQTEDSTYDTDRDMAPPKEDMRGGASA